VTRLASAEYGERDYWGYGRSAPVASWPSGDSVAISVVVHVEEGAEFSPLWGDETTEPENEAAYEIPSGERELAAESFYEYGSRRGIWKLLTVLEEYQIPLTIFAAGQALQNNQELSAGLRYTDHEIVGQGMRFSSQRGQDVAIICADIRATTETVADLTGKEVVGWYSRPPVPTQMRVAIAQTDSLLYDNSSAGDDIPYRAHTTGGSVLVVPCSPEGDDLGYWRHQFFTPSDYSEPIIEALRVLRSESDQGARMFSIQLRPRITGRPGRIDGLKRVLDFVTQNSGFWLARRVDIARHWLSSEADDRSREIGADR
jgi:allantoinase